MLNIILVIYKVRPSCLVATEDDKYDMIKILFKEIPNINLILNGTGLEIGYKKYNPATDNFDISLVFLKGSIVDNPIKKSTKKIDDEQIGKYVGFQCIGHDFGNFKVDRIGINISEKKTNTSFYDEVCEIKKSNINKLTENASKFNIKINNCLNKFGYNTIAKVKIWPGTLTRYSMLKNKNYDYIKKNMDEYINDFENNYISKLFNKSITFKNLKNINKYNINQITVLYNAANVEDRYKKYYNNAQTDKEVENVAKKLLINDNEFWK